MKLELYAAFSQQPLELMGVGAAILSLQKIKDSFSRRGAKHGRETRHIFGRNCLKPFVLAVVAYYGRRRPQILTIDVERALFVQIGFKITVVLAMPLLAKDDFPHRLTLLSDASVPLAEQIGKLLAA
jgi:hypothetical protein